jgi:flagellar hook protein FlgE
MSLYGVMRTSTSGMNAQSTRISAVAENVANANTNGYKAIRTEFSSYFISENVSDYNSGYVDVNLHRMVGNQGTLAATTSMTDLAIQGDGFFIVRNSSGENMLTRAGAYQPNADGELVNAAGFKLMGYPISDANGGIVVNGFAGLEPVAFDSVALSAQASTTGILQTNLPATATTVAPADMPSANAAGSTYTAKTSMVVYGNLGEEILLDVYMSKGASEQWEVAVFDRSQAGANGFPYAAGPLSTATLNFDPSNGHLTPASASDISIAVPNGQPLTLDLSKTSQLAAGFSVQDADVNGNKASAADLVEIADDGTVYVAFEDGTRVARYRIPLATVPSPDNLQAISGNAFGITVRSGDFRIGFSGVGGFGSIASGVLEQSTADIASEFTDMIDAQRGYTANSKVFQTGAELMDVLVNLKR